MTTFHFRKPIVLLTVLVGSVAALAREASAQPRYTTTTLQLSAAINEVLTSPFHEDVNLLGARGQSLLLQAAGFPNAAQVRVDLATSWPAGLPNAGGPLAQVESSPRRAVGPTAFGAIASHVATALFLRCQYSDHGDPGRFTGTGRPGVIPL